MCFVEKIIFKLLLYENNITIGIVHLTMNIKEHSFKHNVIISTKLKQSLIIGLDFAQRYQLGGDWDTSGTLYLWLDRWKTATAIQQGNMEREVMTMHETKLVCQPITSQWCH